MRKQPFRATRLVLLLLFEPEIDGPKSVLPSPARISRVHLVNSVKRERRWSRHYGAHGVSRIRSSSCVPLTRSATWCTISGTTKERSYISTKHFHIAPTRGMAVDC